MALQAQAINRRSVQADTSPTTLTVQQLMKRMGADSFNPAPPDQTRWPSEQPGVDPEHMLWSFIYEHTLAFSSGRPRSEYAIDDGGRPVTIHDAAKHFGWEISNARRTMKRLVLRGVVRN